MLKLRGDRIMVRPFKKEGKRGDLFLPETAIQSEETMGTIVALGDGPMAKDGTPLPHYVNVSDVVIFSPVVGQELDIEGERLIVMRESDVLAVVEGD